MDSGLLGHRPYARRASDAGIAHIGVGNFHRAHQAVVVDELLSRDSGDGWAICGIGLLPTDARMRDALASQDHLFTVTLAHPGGRRETSVVGSIVDYVLASADWDQAVARLTEPEIRIVSLTITESGYQVDSTRTRDHSASRDHSAFALIVHALQARRERGIRPFTVMSCDNIQNNGRVAHDTVIEYAVGVSTELAGWIDANVAFPNSMVDRITPATAAGDREELRDRTGIDDAWPVTAEPFIQWVLEDHFPAGRPPFELAGVQMVSDVAPYEMLKLRLLNGGHQLLAHCGRLLGLTYVHEAVNDPDILNYLRAYLNQDAIPTLHPVPGVDVDAYVSTLIERFSSISIQDTLERVASDAAARLRAFVVPVIIDAVAAGRLPSRAIGIIAFSLAASGLEEPNWVPAGSSSVTFSRELERIQERIASVGVRAMMRELTYSSVPT